MCRRRAVAARWWLAVAAVAARWWLAVAAVAAVAVAVVGGAQAQDTSGLFELDIIHYNDFHVHFEETSPSGSTCEPAVAPCIGGVARLYAAVQALRRAAPAALLLNAGDTFQGTIWYNFLRWDVCQYFMNLFPHDAHTLGNHEFDHGPEGLAPYLSRLAAPALGANVNAAAEPSLWGLFRNHTVVERAGRRVGIIGVLLRTFSAPMGGVVMEDEVTAVNREAELLTSQGVDVIVLLSHCGLDCDINMVPRLSSAVDVIVGGHSHSLLYTGETPNGDLARGEYPTVVEQPGGRRIPIVQASCYTRYLGHIKLFIDDAGEVQGWEGQPLYLGPDIEPDPWILELLEPWREQVDVVGKEVLGRTLTTMNRSWCSSRECNMGSWVCDAFLEEVRERRDAATGAWRGADLCLVNAGGLRAQLDPGNVTTESLLRAVPFENTLQLYSLRGEHLLEALEFSVGVAAAPGAFSSGRMLQVGGLRVVFNVSAPAGARVASLRVRCSACAVPRYEPARPDAVYRVVSQDYIGDGGGGYTMLSEHRTGLEQLELDYVVLQRRLRARAALPPLDGRIQVVE